MFIASTFTLILSLSVFAATLQADNLRKTDDAIAPLRARIAQHQNAAFAREAGKPLVRDKIIVDWNNRGDFTRKYNQSILHFANRVFALDEQQLFEEANAALREMCQYHLDRPQTLFEVHSFAGPVRTLTAVYHHYGPQGNKVPGRMSAETCEIVEKTLWEWANEKSKIADAEVEQSQTWWIPNSENHHSNHFGACWILVGVLKDLPAYKDKPLKDGHTPAAHHKAWTDYAKEYIRQRARKGMLVEINSPSYGTATLGSIADFHEFAEDPVLKNLAGMFVELFWAQVAESQFAGATGGAQTRSAANHNMRGSSSLTGLAKPALGFGEDGLEDTDLLFRIAHGWQEKAPYEIRQRRIGLTEKGFHRPPNYRLKTDTGGFIRYTWCAPEFIMGSFMHGPRPMEDWAAISSQSRWAGVVFPGDSGARVFPAPHHPTGGVILNGFWSVQSKGTMIAQRLASPREVRHVGWRVFFSKAGLSEPLENGGWFFAEADGAYIGVRVLSGETSFEENRRYGRWLVCADTLTPVIIEAGRKADHADFASFQKAAIARPLTFEDGVVKYESLGGDQLTFPADRSRLPEINGKPVDLAPEKVYDSPFVQSKWDSGVVTLRYGEEERILDFNDSTEKRGIEK